jgi:DNA polymerase III delta prime subunit
LVEGANDRIQLEALLSQIILISSKEEWYGISFR